MKRILIIDAELEISNRVRVYLTGQGFDVNLAASGQDGLALTSSWLPDVILLDVELPDIDGYSLCQLLRQTKRSSPIPIIFWTRKDKRMDKIAGLEIGADDYIVKPLHIGDLELLVINLRVLVSMTPQAPENMLDPLTGLPSGRLIEDQLRQLIRKKDWALLDCQIDHFEAFRGVYGMAVAEEVLRFAALLFGEVIEEAGTPNDFLARSEWW